MFLKSIKSNDDFLGCVTTDKINIECSFLFLFQLDNWDQIRRSLRELKKDTADTVFPMKCSQLLWTLSTLTVQPWTVLQSPTVKMRITLLNSGKASAMIRHLAQQKYVVGNADLNSSKRLQMHFDLVMKTSVETLWDRWVDLCGRTQLVESSVGFCFLWGMFDPLIGGKDPVARWQLLSNHFMPS